MSEPKESNRFGNGLLVAGMLGAIGASLKKALEKVSGVTNATVDFDKKTASVTFDPDKVSPATLAKATSDAGYPSTVGN
jgi:copper chaperone CopZ